MKNTVILTEMKDYKRLTFCLNRIEWTHDEHGGLAGPEVVLVPLGALLTATDTKLLLHETLHHTQCMRVSIIIVVLQHSNRKTTSKTTVFPLENTNMSCIHYKSITCIKSTEVHMKENKHKKKDFCFDRSNRLPKITKKMGKSFLFSLHESQLFMITGSLRLLLAVISGG